MLGRGTYPLVVGGNTHGRLDPDHLGAEVGEDRGEERPRPHGGEVEHPQPLQRRRRGVGRPERGSLRLHVAGTRGRVDLAVARRGAPELPSALGEAVRRPGQHDRAQLLVLRVHPEPALVEVIRLQELGRLVHGRDRPPGRLRRVGDLLARVLEEPGVQDAVEDLLRLGPHEGVGPGERLTELVAVEHVEHLGELLGRHHHRDVPVGTREGAERQQGVAAAGRRRHLHGGTLRVLPAEVARDARRRGCEHLHRGQVDEGSRAARAGAQDRGQASERRGMADRGFTEVHRQLHGALPVHHEPAAVRLRDDVAPGVVGVRALRAEARDRDDRRRRITGDDVVAVDAPVGEAALARCLDHQVGALDQGTQGRRRPGRHLDDRAPLVRVQVREEPAVRAHLVTLGRLHLDDVGAEVREGLAAPPRGEPAADLDHPHIAEHLAHASVPSPSLGDDAQAAVADVT